MLIDFEDDGGDLLHREVPVRLVVAGIELLRTSTAEVGAPFRAGLPLLVHEIGPNGLLGVRYAWYTGAKSIELNEYGDSLLVRVGGGQALIHPTQHRHGWVWSPKVTVRVRYPTLLASWQAFAERVHDVVLERHSEAANLRGWKHLTEDPLWIWQGRENARLAADHAACFDTIDAIEDEGG